MAKHRIELQMCFGLSAFCLYNNLSQVVQRDLKSDVVVVRAGPYSFRFSTVVFTIKELKGNVITTSK
jgi:hypothetical protein